MTPNDDIQEELIFLLKAGIDGSEGRRTSESVTANMGRVVQKGVQAGMPPYGLRPVSEIKDGRVVEMALKTGVRFRNWE